MVCFFAQVVLLIMAIAVTCILKDNKVMDWWNSQVARRLQCFSCSQSSQFLGICTSDTGQHMLCSIQSTSLYSPKHYAWFTQNNNYTIRKMHKQFALQQVTVSAAWFGEIFESIHVSESVFLLNSNWFKNELYQTQQEGRAVTGNYCVMQDSCTEACT